MSAKPLHTLCLLGGTAEFVEGIARRLENPDTRLQARWDLADYANADLLVIDTSSMVGHMDWLRAQASQRRAVPYGELRSDAGELHLPKPLRTADLVRVLNRVGEALERARANATADAAAPLDSRTQVPVDVRPAQAAGSIPASAAPSRVAPPSIETPLPPRASPGPATGIAPVTALRHAHRLADLLGESAAAVSPLKLETAGLPTLFLHPATRTWRSTATLKAVGAWCTRELADADVQRLDDAAFAAAAGALAEHAYTRLQWLAELLAHGGGLNPQLDPNARYKLARWPQSEREFPRHFRIATMMLKQADTPQGIAAQSGAALAEVNDFINAYHAIGYVENDMPAPETGSTRRGNLFDRLRKGAQAS